MNNTPETFKFLIALFMLFILRSPLWAGPFNDKSIDPAVRNLDYPDNRCAVVIINSKSGELVYVYNREYAIERRFPPGSIAKTWTAAALLEYPDRFGFSASMVIDCEGKYIIKDDKILTSEDLSLFNLPCNGPGHRYFRCALKAGHGRVSFHKALVQSCNTYFLTAASRHPVELYNTVIDIWDLDNNTGLRSPVSKEPPAISFKNISQFQATAAAIGEGGSILVSPLKVAQTYAALIEGTPLLSPFVKPYRGIKARDQLPLSKKTRDILVSALSEVTHKGTLKNLSISNEHLKVIAGKTGTGTHYRKKYHTHAWNVLFFSYKQKQYVMCVFVYRGRGGDDAKKLSRVILNAL